LSYFSTPTTWTISIVLMEKRPTTPARSTKAKYAICVSCMRPYSGKLKRTTRWCRLLASAAEPSKARPPTWIVRLRDYTDDVWPFMTRADVPFTNNLAEQTVRMPKVKQKVSGCFRTLQGAQTYCVIRSYCATMHKQGANIFESLVLAFKGTPPQPYFA
jgi:hypothetical protein